MPEKSGGGFGGRRGFGGSGVNDVGDYDVEDFIEDLPYARWRRQHRRQQHIAEAPQHPARGPHKGPTGKGSAALRHPRKKKGKYFAA